MTTLEKESTENIISELLGRFDIVKFHEWVTKGFHYYIAVLLLIYSIIAYIGWNVNVVLLDNQLTIGVMMILIGSFAIPTFVLTSCDYWGGWTNTVISPILCMFTYAMHTYFVIGVLETFNALPGIVYFANMFIVNIPGVLFSLYVASLAIMKIKELEGSETPRKTEVKTEE